MAREATRISLNQILESLAPKQIDGIPINWSLDFTSQEIAVVLTYNGSKHIALRTRNKSPEDAIKAAVDECVKWARKA